VARPANPALPGTNLRLILRKFGTFAGMSHLANAIPDVALAILLAGLARGFALKSTNPAAYKNTGHMVNEG
jgi:hypothetical protein